MAETTLVTDDDVVRALICAFGWSGDDVREEMRVGGEASRVMRAGLLYYASRHSAPPEVTEQPTDDEVDFALSSWRLGWQLPEREAIRALLVDLRRRAAARIRTASAGYRNESGK